MKTITYSRPVSAPNQSQTQTPVREAPKPGIREAASVGELILLAGLQIP